jgi:hypothetical protein
VSAPCAAGANAARQAAAIAEYVNAPQVPDNAAFLFMKSPQGKMID